MSRPLSKTAAKAVEIAVFLLVLAVFLLVLALFFGGLYLASL